MILPSDDGLVIVSGGLGRDGDEIIAPLLTVDEKTLRAERGQQPLPTHGGIGEQAQTAPQLRDLVAQLLQMHGT